MTDYRVTSNEDMASDFIVSTCQLLPKTCSLSLDCMHDLNMSSEPDAKWYSIDCGSMDEMYILPLKSCIGDSDSLQCRIDELVFCDDIPVLPRDLSGLFETIQWYKVEPCLRYPGFVLLREVGEMVYNWNHKKYELSYAGHKEKNYDENYLHNRFRKIMSTGISGPPIDLCYNWRNKAYEFYYGNHKENYVALDMNAIANLPNSYFSISKDIDICGPAIKTYSDCYDEFCHDGVRAMFCPHWPKEASHWPVRSRKSGWPTSDTISEIVQNGCHVVYAQHRACKNERLQWRLSFSLAEKILLQSWTPIQQIVYHLLRYCLKRELKQTNFPKEDEVLRSYHLKTLMLWTCEEMTSDWWNFNSVIAITCELLRKLSEWLKGRSCLNYFIPEANLFYEGSNSEIYDNIERRLRELCSFEVLSHWFVENYILPITRIQLAFLNTGKENPDFMDYLLPLFEFRKLKELESVGLYLSVSFSNSDEICRTSIKNRFCSGWGRRIRNKEFDLGCHFGLRTEQTHLPMTEKISCYKYCNTIVYVLNAAWCLDYGKISWDSSLFIEFVNALTKRPNIVTSRYHNYPKSCTEQRGRLHFLYAQGFMENLTGSGSSHKFQFLSIMSKQCLKRAVEFEDSRCNGIALASVAYLAALEFATSEFQKDKVFCYEQIHQNSKESLNAGCLLFIDDVTRIVGLCILHKKLIDDNLQYINRRIYLDLRLSPDVFIHYLGAISAERISAHQGNYDDFPDSAFSLDANLKALKLRKAVASKSCNRCCHSIYRSAKSSIEVTDDKVRAMNVKETLLAVLMEYALEKATSLYSALDQDFGIKCNTADCYQALYLYKYQRYNEALDLCERILDVPELKIDFKKIALANVLLLPPLDFFFDKDVQSLLGFHTLFYFLSPHNEIRESECRYTIASSFEHWFAKYVYFQRKLLSTFLLGTYHVRCSYYLGSHFLARYLKVRCYIDCNLPYSEALTEFASQETVFPFEHIIRKFLLRINVFVEES